jgi:hypothetical protein
LWQDFSVICVGSVPFQRHRSGHGNFKSSLSFYYTFFFFKQLAYQNRKFCAYGLGSSAFTTELI